MKNRSHGLPYFKAVCGFQFLPCLRVCRISAHPRKFGGLKKARLWISEPHGGIELHVSLPKGVPTITLSGVWSTFCCNDSVTMGARRGISHGLGYSNVKLCNITDLSYRCYGMFLYHLTRETTVPKTHMLWKA